MVEKFMKIVIKKEVTSKIYETVQLAGINEIKGSCYAFHKDNDLFEIEETYISQQKGTFSFSNLIINCKYNLFEKRYYKKHRNNFKEHNYIGDWHSHPSFKLKPSNYDIEEVNSELINSNANFLIQIIVKIVNNELIGKCYYYNRNSVFEECILEIEK